MGPARYPGCSPCGNLGCYGLHDASTHCFGVATQNLVLAGLAVQVNVALALPGPGNLVGGREMDSHCLHYLYCSTQYGCLLFLVSACCIVQP